MGYRTVKPGENLTGLYHMYRITCTGILKEDDVRGTGSFLTSLPAGEDSGK